MRAARMPAFLALPIATVATGMPPGICTIDNSESMPSRYFSGTGTPMTGSGVTEASMPGRWAAPPAPAMTTDSPRVWACRPHSIISVGIRCAETTSASHATPSSVRISPASCMTGQSESEPITIPTLALLCWACSLISLTHPSSLTGVAEVAAEPACGVPGALETVLEVVAVGVDVPDLATGSQVLAVEVHPEPGVARHRVRQTVVEPAAVGGSAEDVHHHGPAAARGRRTQREVHDGAEVVLELGRHGAVLGPVAGVVGAHRQLVDQDAAVGRLEELDGEDARDVERTGDAQGDLLRLTGEGGREVGRRSDHLVTDAVELSGGDDRVGRGLAAGRARDQGRELAPEVDELLGEDLHTRSGGGV